VSAMPAQPIKAAIVGLGRWGKTLVDSVQGKSERIRFTHAVSRDPTQHRDFLEQRQLLGDTRFADILADPTIDAVVLATPHTQHVAAVVAACAIGEEHAREAIFDLSVGGAGPDRELDASALDRDAEQIVGDEVVQPVHRVPQLGDVVTRIAVDAGLTEAAARVDELADARPQIVENVRQAQVAVHDRAPSVALQALGVRLDARPQERQVGHALAVHHHVALVAHQRRELRPALHAGEAAARLARVHLPDGALGERPRVLAELGADDLGEMHEDPLPHARIHVLEQEDLRERRVAVVLHLDPWIVPVGGVVDETRKEHREVGRQEPEVVDLVDELLALAAALGDGSEHRVDLQLVEGARLQEGLMRARLHVDVAAIEPGARAHGADGRGHVHTFEDPGQLGAAAMSELAWPKSPASTAMIAAP